MFVLHFSDAYHVLSPKQVLREMRRVVRPGGYLMIVDGYHHRHVWTLTEVSDFLCGIDHRRLQRDLADNGVQMLHLSDAGLTHLGETVGRKTTFSNFLLLGRVIGESACGTTEKVSPARDALGSLSLLSARGVVNPGSSCSIVLEKRSIPCFFPMSCSL